ncbi:MULTISPECIES: hypothetical protein [unclassified Streptomyces]|uniref:hypothetical protein n=1 Tax=unclassified Streptomyces TaxID=2593676 RepID=UPI00226D4B9C|nr:MULTISPECIES: hypothetical protein [unclassified Streptomyces]MCY0916865.1 hypothetical protein [Streptomyces sp. H27-G5]MCY0958021.1 hypothetical protein [Streptomyces sp. H27-H5]
MGRDRSPAEPTWNTSRGLSRGGTSRRARILVPVLVRVRALVRSFARALVGVSLT